MSIKSETCTTSGAGEYIIRLMPFATRSGALVGEYAADTVYNVKWNDAMVMWVDSHAKLIWINPDSPGRIRNICERAAAVMIKPEVD